MFGKLSIRLKKLFLLLIQSKKATIGAIMLLFVAIISIFASFIAPYPYVEMNVGKLLETPSLSHLMGVDVFGRDVFSRVVYGTRVSFGVSLIVVTFSLVIGTPLGLISGYFGGTIDRFVMAFSDTILAFPWVLMALTVASIMGPGLYVIIIALGIVFIPEIVRLVRSVTLSLREREFIDAAVVTGESKASIIFRYLLPNTLPPLIVQSTLIISKAILAEASISYLGYGIQPPMPSWGIMLSDSSNYFWSAPYLCIFPGLAIVLLVLAVNFFGDGLRDMLDPRYKGKVNNL